MKVLIADDSQPIRERLVDRLSRLPELKVFEAVDTPDALRQMELYQPDVAVLDIRMPGGGGIKALTEIKKSCPSTTVMVMTNYPYAQYRRKCLELGADFFFDKSTEFEKVAETVRELMNVVNVGEVALRTTAEQLVAAREQIEQNEQRQRDMHILSLLQKPGAADGSDQAYVMWEKTFDAMPDLVAIFDTDHTIIRVNKALADRMEMPAAELTGKKCFEYIHRTNCPIPECPHEQMLKDGREHSYEMFSEALQSWFYTTVSPILENGRLIGAIHISHDITERKRADIYREAGREVLQILNEPANLRDAIGRILNELKMRTGFDAVGIRLKTGDDFPYFVQEGFPSDFLMKENALLARTTDGGICRDKDGHICLECTCGLVIAGKTDSSSAFFTKGGSFWTNESSSMLKLPPGEDRRIHPRNACIHLGYTSVALIPIRTTDQIVGLIQLNDRRSNCFTLETVEMLEGIAAHIGEALIRKQAEQDLKVSELRYRQLFESMQSGFALHEIICDEKGIPCDYRFLEVNPAFETLTGLKAENLIGRTVKDVMPATESRWIENYGKVALTGESLQIDDFAGALGRHFSVSAYSPAPGQFATIFNDTTEQKKAEVAIINARDAAQAANLAKTQFLANMSHELRTPLNAIIGFTEILQFGNLDEEQLEYIKTIGTSGETMLTLISDLLDLSRIELGKTDIKNETFNIREAVFKAVALLSAQAKSKGIELDYEVEETVPIEITSDPVRLQQVLVNLLNNAVKFTEKGFVRLTARGRVSPAGSLRIEFSVADSGEGMDDATIKRIFRPFQQGDNSSTRTHGGAGLGLAISKNLVAMMGGSISVESRKGEGSVFNFNISDRTVRQKQAAAEDVRDFWRGRRVCIWDEDPADLRAAEYLVERCGMIPCFAENMESIACCLTGEAQPDVVLCNLDMSGLAERLPELRKIRPGVPWIGLSRWERPLDSQMKDCFAAFGDRPPVAEQFYGALLKIAAGGRKSG